MNIVLSGCKAEHGCRLASFCERYILYLVSTPYKGFNASHLCITPSHDHFIPLETPTRRFEAPSL